MEINNELSNRTIQDLQEYLSAILIDKQTHHISDEAETDIRLSYADIQTLHNFLNAHIPIVNEITCGKCKHCGTYDTGPFTSHPHHCCELIWQFYQADYQVDADSQDEKCPLKYINFNSLPEIQGYQHI